MRETLIYPSVKNRGKKSPKMFGLAPGYVPVSHTPRRVRAMSTRAQRCIGIQDGDEGTPSHTARRVITGTRSGRD